MRLSLKTDGVRFRVDGPVRSGRARCRRAMTGSG
jgi:hypothetical protein